MDTRQSKANPYKHIYNSSTWKRLRLLILSEEPLCRMCKAEGRIVVAVDCDHIIPLTSGGEPYDIENIQPLCRLHHRMKTAQDQGHAVNWGCAADGTPLNPKHHWRT